MHASQYQRGCIELVGPTWWLKRYVAIADPETGELVRRRRRVRLGSKRELRTRAQARQRADQWLASIAPEILVPGPQILAVEYLEHFLAMHVPAMRPTSRLKYRTVIRVHLIPKLGELRLQQVDTAAMRELVNESARRLARATVASIRGILLQILRQAIRDGYGACRIDPRDVRLPPTTLEVQRRHIRDDELVRILAAAGWPWRALWALMGYAGLRIGEALGLTWSHVDLEHQVLLIRQAAIAGELAPLKTRTSRADVPILAPLAEILQEYHAGAWIQNAGDLLFVTRRGGAYSADDVRRRQLQPLLNALCMPHAGCHAFRHGLPARLAGAGVSPDMVQKIMRHGTLAMTERYLHTGNQDTIRSLAAKGLMREAIVK